MLLNLVRKNLDTVSCPALVVFSKISTKDKAARLTHSELAKSLAPSIEEKTITGKHLESVLFRDKNYQSFRHIIVVGLGLEKDVNHEVVRQAAAAAFDAVKASGAVEAAIDFDGLVGGSKKEAASYARAVAEGMTLASYVFDELKSSSSAKAAGSASPGTAASAGSKKKAEDKKPELTFHVVSASGGDAAVKKAFNEGLILAQTVNFSRRLGDLPGNYMTPTILANSAVEAAKGLAGVKVTVWDRARIVKEKMGGLLGVSLGSTEEPRFIIVEYRGAAATKKPVVYVGKGLTFDSGGISIKPSGGMEEMKYDMCGGANVLGAVLAIARLKLKVNAIALVASTENMPGPAAMKPGDVLTARNGKTFEVNNTDAEGRLILSDALSYASELEPQVIVDAATLTGAMVVALGNTHTGFFTRNDALAKRISGASEASGEWTWRMPLTDFHLKDMRGTFADLSNISASKGAGSATAAAFLEQFVGEGIPWAHFDIAGTAWAVGSRLNYCTKKGASGAIIRTFVELAKSYV